MNKCQWPPLARELLLLEGTTSIIVQIMNIARWSIRTDTRRAVRQTRREQHVPMQPFVNRKRLNLQTKDKEGDVTTKYYYN